MDSDRVEAGCHEEIAERRRLSQQIAVVRGETLGPVEEGSNADRAEYGNPRRGFFQFRRDMVPVVGQGTEFEVGRDAVDGPGLRLWLEETNQQFAGIFLEIGTFVGHTQNRRIAGKTRHRLGHDVKMLARLQRNRNARHGSDLARP